MCFFFSGVFFLLLLQLLIADRKEKSSKTSTALRMNRETALDFIVQSW